MSIFKALIKSKPLIKVGKRFMNCNYCGDELLITAITSDTIECRCSFCGKKYSIENTFKKGQY